MFFFYIPFHVSVNYLQHAQTEPDLLGRSCLPLHLFMYFISETILIPQKYVLCVVGMAAVVFPVSECVLLLYASPDASGLCQRPKSLVLAEVITWSALTWFVLTDWLNAWRRNQGTA